MAVNSKVNMREIARLSGVAPSTVSRVLSKKPGVISIASDTRQRVIDAVNKLGYQPNIHAKRLFSQKSQVLGMVVPPFSRLMGSNSVGFPPHVDTLLAETMNGAIEVATRYGYYIMVAVADDKFIKRKDYLNLFRSRSVDGLLIWGICLDEYYIEELEQEQKHFVLLNTYHKDKCFNRVYVNNEGGSVQLCRHLLGLGHKTIGYIAGSKISTIGLERRAGFVNELQKAGVYREDLVVEGDYSIESGRKACEQLLAREPHLTAIGCGNDSMALGVIETLSAKGLRVPEDISVTGADASFPYSFPRLTSFRPPLFEVGLKATEALINRLENKEENEEQGAWVDICLETEQVIGNSTSAVCERH
jgi:DNA-binding LacI/PurR family transcriptional regulator